MDKLKEFFISFGNNLKALNKEQIFHQIDLGLQIIRKVVLNFMALGILALGLLFGIAVGYFASILNEESIPTVSQIDKLIHDVDQSSTLYFADNSSLGEIQSDIVSYKVKSNQISPWIKKAIVASEDEDFYIHRGVMPRAVFRAALSDIFGLGAQTGGSTLTQQLVKMQILSSETTFKRKATEIFLAMRVSKFFSKDDVLTSYLNAASFGRNNKGENINGIGAAAQGIFGKNCHDLSIAQSAFVVGLVQSPFAYTPFDNKGAIDKNTVKYGLKRSKIVLFRLYRDGKLSKEQYHSALKEDLSKEFLKPAASTKHINNNGYTYSAVKEEAQDILANVLMDDDGIDSDKVKESTYKRYYDAARLKLSQNGYKIYSTINPKINNSMQQILTNSRDLFSETHTDSVYDQQKNDFVELSEPVQHGTVVLDNKSGGVLGFIGGVDFKLNEFNHAFNNRRSPGSSIKPLLVYGPAIDSGIIGSHSVLADFPAKYGNYEPSDYDQTFQNRFVSATESLAQSYNVPTVNLYQALRQKDTNLAKSYMDKMNIELTDKEYNELGISLGGTDHGLSPLQEAGAYAAFSNDGDYQRPYVVSKILDPTGRVVYEHKTKKVKVYSDATSYIMRKMMQEVVQNGTATLLGSNLEFDSDKLYGKTGTSNDNRDYWFTGSTPGITISSWIGYDNRSGNSYNLQMSDSDSNLRYVARILNRIYENNPDFLKLNEQKSKPKSVKEYNVLLKTGTLPGTINTNSSSFTMRGQTVESLYAKGEPKEISVNFGIGGYASDYRLFWANYFGQYNGYGIVSSAFKGMEYDTSNPKEYFSYYEAPRNSSSNNYYNSVNNNQGYYNQSGNENYYQNYNQTGNYGGLNNSNGYNQNQQTNQYGGEDQNNNQINQNQSNNYNNGNGQ
ncbi:transglycosylase domain-containing protein [Xylocopilactobacillus apis]|uniref:Carboxypeptidase n=1 Tax=Xylocopilactobacillus apis TaxID=2932183 RepID=A0AAU9D7N4_9LACO|nr:transglycosylase domain-containing protein [Xylocopilactobacillus apis]BDR56792.1 carboxypeptidase [Xylocopilactobacillus apis]